jgi:hypothetical protein
LAREKVLQDFSGSAKGRPRIASPSSIKKSGCNERTDLRHIEDNTAKTVPLLETVVEGQAEITGGFKVLADVLSNKA